MKTFYAILSKHLAFLGPVPHSTIQEYLSGPVTPATKFPSVWRDRDGRTVRMVNNHLMRRVLTNGLAGERRNYGYVYAVYTDPGQTTKNQFPWTFEGGMEYNHLHQASVSLMLSQGFTLGDFVELLRAENRILQNTWDLYNAQRPIAAPPDLLAQIEGKERSVKTLWVEIQANQLVCYCQYQDPILGLVTCQDNDLLLTTHLSQSTQTVIQERYDRLAQAILGEPTEANWLPALG